MLSYRNIDFDKDVPEIVSLLRTSLSDNHNVSNFLWKHVENPFGKSYGLLACDKHKIVGVRMFMFWKFTNKDQTINAIRPVDTIIDPDYRGKGLFKKLTLAGLENCAGSYELIFNTPNQNSLPGYIKMGWHKFENLAPNNFSLLVPAWSAVNKIKKLALEDFDEKKIASKKTNTFKTELSDAYVKWRYSDESYNIAFYNGEAESCYLIYRLATVKKIKTIVLVQVIGCDKMLKNALKALAAKEKVVAVYYKSEKKLFTLSKILGQGDVVCKEDKLNIYKQLDFSLADLEGRL